MITSEPIILNLKNVKNVDFKIVSGDHCFYFVLLLVIASHLK